MNYTSILAEDKNLITYRPSLRKICGSVTATILFQQILFWYKKSKGKPFFKFKAPCNNEYYKEGDSWTEELSFSVREFDSALKTISKKVRKSQLKESIDNETFVYYWTDTSRKTWYFVDEIAVEKALAALYVNADMSFRKTTNCSLAVNADLSFSVNADLSDCINRDYQRLPETTTEKEEKADPSDQLSVKGSENNFFDQKEEKELKPDQLKASKKEKEKKVAAKKEKEIQYPFGEKFLESWQEWKDYKAAEFSFRFKSKISEQKSLTKLQKIAKTENEAIEILNYSIENGYRGFFEKKGSNTKLKQAVKPSNLEGVTEKNFFDSWNDNAA